MVKAKSGSTNQIKKLKLGNTEIIKAVNNIKKSFSSQINMEQLKV